MLPLPSILLECRHVILKGISLSYISTHPHHPPIGITTSRAPHQRHAAFLCTQANALSTEVSPCRVAS